ncbi:crotonobetainyl-CoA:carnitine CoA-transferase CaiB-like acyl-CoA transferase [Inhella inkyongensis]|uniref:Crotonobetainyl-CoA:carnitine CoA-transferase CaiB-like acyl-CoA transferase n=2 Tax=Inhella inkyongensis TaxID=392593 RepID=A0A840S9A0_9BURK|nr:crotonobetainyl-CoA:carnitine CoA-transferase CaiB-like acyl-CoA transferase [Inhella inkyongensis]
MLADLGADVIKVERPGRGDDTRAWGPPFLREADGQDSAESAYFLCANRNKRSITVDLAHPQGQALVRELAARADILVENFKVGDLARYGLAPAQLQADFPALIVCSITGFGQTGPWAERPGYDFVVQGLGGLMSVTGAADGEAGAGPQKVGVAVADLFTGMNASVAMLAALRHRDRTGQGQHIDLALLDSQLAMLANLGSQSLCGGAQPTRQGNAHPSIAPYQSYAAADGHLIIAVGNDRQFERLAQTLNQPQLAQDPRYRTNSARVAHRAELAEAIQQVLQQSTRAHWLTQLEIAGVPCAPIETVEAALASPQAEARGMVVQLDHPLEPALRQVGNPIKFSGTPIQYRLAPPRLGQHSDEILKEWLETSPEAIAEWRRSGALG